MSRLLGNLLHEPHAIKEPPAERNVVEDARPMWHAGSGLTGALV